MIIFYLLYNWIQFLDVVLTIRGLENVCIVLGWCLGRSITEHTFFDLQVGEMWFTYHPFELTILLSSNLFVSLFNTREAHGFRWNHHGFSGIDSVFTYGEVFKYGELCARGRYQGQGQVVASQIYCISYFRTCSAVNTRWREIDSRLLFTSEDFLCANLRVQEQSMSQHKNNMTSQCQ